MDKTGGKGEGCGGQRPLAEYQKGRNGKRTAERHVRRGDNGTVAPHGHADVEVKSNDQVYMLAEAIQVA